jgi:hypothetical protein
MQFVAVPSLAQFDRAIAYMETTLANRKVAHHLGGQADGLAPNRLIETPTSQRCGERKGRTATAAPNEAKAYDEYRGLTPDSGSRARGPT